MQDTAFKRALAAVAVHLVLLVVGLPAIAQPAAPVPVDAASAATPASAAAATARNTAAPGLKAELKLGIIDGSASAGSTVALNYQLGYRKLLWVHEYDSVGTEIVDQGMLKEPAHSGVLDLSARGTLTASRERNPNKLLDFSGTFGWRYLTDTMFARLGGVLVYETDQGHQNSQKVIGLSALASTSPGLLSNGDSLTGNLTYGDVKPDKDEVRRKTVGHLDSFRRWSAEVTYSTDISMVSKGEGLDLLQWRQLHLGYRHYQEESPEFAIKAAGLGRNRLGYIRLILAGGAYIQYARGSLPFDLKSDHSVQIGFSQTLK